MKKFRIVREDIHYVLFYKKLIEIRRIKAVKKTVSSYFCCFFHCFGVNILGEFVNDYPKLLILYF